MELRYLLYAYVVYCHSGHSAIQDYQKKMAAYGDDGDDVPNIHAQKQIIQSLIGKHMVKGETW
jgi:hypothetical protein